MITYEDFEALPFRGSMGRTSKYWRNYDYGSHLSEFFRWLRCFVRSSVGRKFDDVYHYLCKKYPGNIGRISPRDEFKRWVGKSRWASYYVDDEGIIREKEPRWRQPKKNFVKIATSEERFYYALNTTDHRIRYAIYVQIAERYSKGEALSMLVTGCLSPAVSMSLSKLVFDRLSCPWALRNCVEYMYKVDLTEYKILYRGTKEFARHFAEAQYSAKSASKKRKKQWAGHSELDMFLKKDNASRKAKKAEDARKRRQEILRNIIDRNRLGFGEDSFMGSNYNSRKGKKEKRLLEGKDVV